MEANSGLIDTYPEAIPEINSGTPTTVMETTAESDPPVTALEFSSRNRMEGPLSDNSHTDVPLEGNASMTEETTQSSQDERYSQPPSNEQSNDVEDPDQNRPESCEMNAADTIDHPFPFNRGLVDSAEIRNGQQESSFIGREQTNQVSLEVTAGSMKSHEKNAGCLKEEHTLRNQPLTLQSKVSTRPLESQKESESSPKSNTSNLNPNEINSKVNQSNFRQEEASICDGAACRPKNSLPIRDEGNEVSLECSNGSQIRKNTKTTQPYPQACYDFTVNGKHVRAPVDRSDGGPNHVSAGSVAQSFLVRIILF